MMTERGPCHASGEALPLPQLLNPDPGQGGSVLIHEIKRKRMETDAG